MIRQTKAWKELRELIAHNKQNDKDPITNKKLLKGYNLHHLDPADYDNLNPNKFVALNKKTHDLIHFLFRYYKNDKQIIKRLVYYLDSMLIGELK